MNDSPTDAAADDDQEDLTPSGLIEIRRALLGLGLIWLTAVSAVGALLAAVYGVTVTIEYLLGSVLAAAVAVWAARMTVQTFKTGS